MESDREHAERELTALLNRALRFVPYVRLDCVEDVIDMFQRAVDLMESNLQLSDSEDEQNHDESEFGGAGAGQGGNQFGGATDASRANASAVAQKLLGAAITKDFSSPSASKRSLGSKSQSDAGAPSANASAAQQRLLNQSKPGGGLGLGKPQQPPIAQTAPHHKLSSRATAALAANLSIVSTDEDKTDSDREDSAKRSEPEADRPRMPLGQPKNKLLARAAMSSSKEFPSPKLGPRSLSAQERSISGSSKPGDLVVQDVEQPELAAPAILPEAGALVKPHTDVTHSPVPQSTTLQDLVESKLKPVDKLKQEIPIPVSASPKHFKSSLHLLSLAGRSGDGSETPTEGTPKPSYLRRLDSPDSHHGQLIQSKAKLQTLINRAIQNVPLVKTSAMPKIRAAIEKAVEKLEASTVALTQN